MIFAPSLTTLWKKCPLQAHLERVEQLEPRQNRNLLARLTGTAVAEGTAVLHNAWAKAGSGAALAPYVVAQAKERSTKYLSLAATHYQVCGVAIEPSSVDGKLLEVQRVIERYAKATPLAGFTILAVEKELTEYGRCRIDLGLATKDGDLAIADVKYKANLDDKYRQVTINEYLRSWQFDHYAWAYSKTLGKPVPLKYLILITMRPAFSINLYPMEIDPEWMQVWEQSAKQAWTDMEEERKGLRVIAAAAVHRDNFGPCPMEKVCFDYKLDVELARAHDYVAVPQFDFNLALQRETEGKPPVA